MFVFSLLWSLCSCCAVIVLRCGADRTRRPKPGGTAALESPPCPTAPQLVRGGTAISKSLCAKKWSTPVVVSRAANTSAPTKVAKITRLECALAPVSLLALYQRFLKWQPGPIREQLGSFALALVLLLAKSGLTTAQVLWRERRQAPVGR